MKAGHLTSLSELFKVLSDPMRLQVILALQHKELCVCDLAEALGVTPPAISHHLRMLKSVRLVRYYRSGKHVYYKLDDDHIEQLIAIANAHILESTTPERSGTK